MHNVLGLKVKQQQGTNCYREEQTKYVRKFLSNNKDIELDVVVFIFFCSVFLF